MSDRPHTDLPLAEIIGWTNDGPDGYGSTWWISPDGERVRLDDPPQPTADELVGWLRAVQIDGTYRVENRDAIELWWDPEDDAWHVSIGVNIDTDGPTLSDALEAAVRKVAAGG